MLKITTGKFVQIPNMAFAFGTDYKLNDDELKVYAYLQWMKNVGTMNIRTHVTIIIEDLGWSTSKASRDKARASKALEGLRDKGYINLSFKSDIKKDALSIEIVEEMKNLEVTSTVDWKDKPFTFKGFTEISKEEYNLAVENDYHMTVMAYHNWRANANFQYAISDKEWAEVLEFKTVKQARSIISGCNFLTKISGEYYQDSAGHWKQETNQYQKNVGIKTNIPEINTNSILEKERAKVTDENVLSDSNIFAQIFDKSTKLKWDGYRAWKQTHCEHVKQAGQRKLNAIAKAKNGEYVVKKLEQEYQDWLEREKQIEMQIKRMEEMTDFDSFVTEEEYKERLHKTVEAKRAREKELSIEDFLDDI